MSATIAPRAAIRPRILTSGDWISCIVILLLIAIVYGQALSHDFVHFDDSLYVQNNDSVKRGLTLGSVLFAWTTLELGNWIPLTWMSYELDTTLFGTAPAGYIFTNIALHAANSLLFYSFLRTTTGMTGASFATALLFAIHPQHVESVAWIAERKDVLSTFFLFLTLHTWVFYTRQPRWQTYLLTIVTFTLGLLAKPMLVTLPLLLLLLDYWPLGRIRQSATATKQQRVIPFSVRLVIEQIPLLLISFCFGLMALYAQADAGALADHGSLSISRRLTTGVTGIVAILRQTFLPTQLTPYYPGQTSPDVGWEWLVPTLILFAITIAAFSLRRRCPYLLMGWLWFVISILPVCGVVQIGGQAYADRYSYVPHIGLLIAIVWLLFSIKDEWKFAPIVKWGIIAIATCFFAMLTSLQVGYWQNQMSLWTYTLSVNEANWMAHHHLGRYLHNNGHPHEALAHLLRARELAPDAPPVPDALSVIYTTLGDKKLAINSSLDALELDPESYEIRLRLARLLRDTNRLAEARAILKDSLKHFPNDPALEFGLGSLAMEERDWATAVEQFEIAAKLLPNDTAAPTLRAACLVQLKRIPEAIDQLKKLIQQDPRDSDLRLHLIDLYIEQGDTSLAMDQLQQILIFDQANVQAIQLLKKLQPPAPNISPKD